MRIALLCYHSCPLARLGEREAGGMSVYVRNLAQALARQGAQVDIFTRRHNVEDPQSEEIEKGVRLIHIDAGPPLSEGSLAPYLPEFARGASAFAEADGARYQVVHSHYWLSGLAGLELAPVWGARHIATFHTLAEVKLLADPEGQEPPERSPAERRIVAETDALVVSDQHERELLARHYGAPRDKVTVLPRRRRRGDLPPHGQSGGEAAFGARRETRAVVCVGGFDPLKRYDLAVSAAALLRERHRVEVVLVGGDLERDPEARRLSELAASLEMDGNVRFAGTVPHGELPWHYNAADVLLAPSYYESFGLVALEAMACGTPVVAARTGGLSTLVRDGETGYLVPLHTPECYADRIEVLLANDALREAMGRAGRQRAEALSWDAVGLRFAEFYGGFMTEEAVR